jgi:ApaG protein
VIACFISGFRKTNELTVKSKGNNFKRAPFQQLIRSNFIRCSKQFVMVRINTDGITISAETFYQHDSSDPVNSEYNFKCLVIISNESRFPVKLIHRSWVIFDSNGSYRNIKGNGLEGYQPIIESGEVYDYVVECTLLTDMGAIDGTYLFEDLTKGTLHQLHVPRIEMVAPFKAN